ncbi:MAG: nitroreductase family protein [Leadbetterella sp.]|nr:nitroreductase family protein [Leadbetterella sp.]
MNLEEVLHFRRSVRLYDKNKPIDTAKVKHCLELATLAPNSSNMQLWEFYHITNETTLKRLSHACLDQSAATTASQMVVFVTRQDLHRKRASEILKFEYENILKNSPPEKHKSRMAERRKYFKLVMPFLYTRFFGIPGLVRKMISFVIGFFRPMVRYVSENDVRIVVHKSCGLAAQTFMIAMANEGYDTCPMEGFDARRVKKILNLSGRAEINMIISCGIRKDNLGIRGERFRIPFNKVYKEI